MKKTVERVPKFRNEDEEREFWATHSPLDYFDPRKVKKSSFPNLRPSTRSISMRVPEDMLAELKILANKKDIPYQRLAKVFLARQIAVERGFVRRSSRKARTNKAHA